MKMEKEEIVIVPVRMKKSQKEKLKENAHKARMNVSEFVRFKTLGEK